jgi:hypothetical protein
MTEESRQAMELSPAARSLVRRLLKGKIPGCGAPGHGKCPPESVADECTRAGLAVQTERPLHEPRHMYPLHKTQFRARARELGFEVPEVEAEGRIDRGVES